LASTVQRIQRGRSCESEDPYNISVAGFSFPITTFGNNYFVVIGAHLSKVRV
jgi:hypothetical protein